MKKTIIWIFISIFIVLVGWIIFANSIKTNKLETNEHKIVDEFNDIKIISNTADIVLAYTEEQTSLVVCDERKNVNHSVKVKDNILVIKVEDNRKWYEYITVNFKTPKITIYLSKTEYSKLWVESSTGDINIPKDFKFSNIDILVDTGNIVNYSSVYENIKIKTSTGNIHTENMIANNIDLSTSTGKVNIIGVNCLGNIKINVSTGKTNIINTNCTNLFSKGSTGNISLENVIGKEKFSIETNTGDVKFKDCDASDIFVKTDTGNVTGNLLTDKVIFAETDTGYIDIPKIIANEKCEIITDTGDIKITID